MDFSCFFSVLYVIASRMSSPASDITRLSNEFMFFWYLSKCEVGVLKIIKIFRVRVISTNCSHLVWAWDRNIYITNQYLFYFFLSNSYCKLKPMDDSAESLTFAVEPFAYLRCWLSKRWALIVVVSSQWHGNLSLSARQKLLLVQSSWDFSWR